MHRFFKHTGRDRLQMVGRLSERPAWLESPYRRQPPGRAAVEPVPFTVDNGLGANRDRYVEVASHLDTEKAALCDADDLDGMSIERDLPAHDPSVAAECALPERVTDDRARRAATALIICVREHEPQDGLYAEHIEEVPAHPQPVFGTALLALLCKVKGRGAPGEKTGKGLLLLPNLFPQRIGQLRASAGEAPRTRAWYRNPHLGEFLRVLDGQRAQPHRIQQLKDRRIRADAKRQGQHSNQREAGFFPQPPCAITQVMPECLHIFSRW